MPELPEVETIRIGLGKKIIGLKIIKIQINSPKSFIGNPNLVEGQKVLKVWRRAKILGMDLIGSYTRDSLTRKKTSKRENEPTSKLVTILFHLKMSGQLVWKGESGKGEGKRFIGGHPTQDMRSKMPNSHTRVIFSFSDGSHLYFNDQRRFGWVKVIENWKLKNENFLGKLGPEPLEKEFNWQILKSNLLNHKSQPIKVAIMDQSVVSGVGNIYANEACFLAKIDPRIKVVTLKDNQFQALYLGVVGALREGIKHGGSSRAHFVDAEGHKGYFLDYAYVYGRDKHPCKKCQTEIKKIQLRGRGTYLCPNCQN